jgi:hypothetical protein
MSFPCKFCGILLFPSSSGKKIFFEDDARTIFHDCSILKNNQKLNFNCKLLASTITRVSKLEKQMSIIQKRFDIFEGNAV